MHADLALRGVDFHTRAGGKYLLGVEGLRLLNRQLPQVHRVVGHLHRISDHPVFAVLGLEGLDELLVGGTLQALEVAHAGVVANGVIAADAFDLVFRHNSGQQRLLRAVQSGRAQLLVERHVRPTHHRAVDAVGLGSLDLVND
ncbi:hypothetical protein D9M68_892360 [compost metagenome]